MNKRTPLWKCILAHNAESNLKVLTGKLESILLPWRWFFRFWEATSYIFLLTPRSAAETEQYQIKANVTYLACCCSASAAENGATWIQQCCCCCWSLWSCCQDWESPLLCWIPAAALRLQCREWNFALSAFRRDTAPPERSSCTTATSVPLLPSRPVGSTGNHASQRSASHISLIITSRFQISPHFISYIPLSNYIAM